MSPLPVVQHGRAKPPAAGRDAFLPTSLDEVRARGWSALDVLLVTGDAYVDHPSFGAAVIGRVLEAAGYKVGIVAQPDWRSTADVLRMGRPRLFVGITSGAMDSMVNHYTAHKRRRSDDAYTPDAAAGRRPDRAATAYARLCREAFGPATPIVLGGIEASLRRIAHYDYWDDRVPPSVLVPPARICSCTGKERSRFWRSRAGSPPARTSAASWTSRARRSRCRISRSRCSRGASGRSWSPRLRRDRARSATLRRVQPALPPRAQRRERAYSCSGTAAGSGPASSS